MINTILIRLMTGIGILFFVLLTYSAIIVGVTMKRASDAIIDLETKLLDSIKDVQAQTTKDMKILKEEAAANETKLKKDLKTVKDLSDKARRQ